MISFLLNALGLTTKKPTAEGLSQHGYTAIVEWLDRDIPKRMKSQNITGMGIAIVDGDKTVAQKGYGYADLNAGLAVTKATHFRAGSVTKSFTAVGVLQLAEQGLLDLDVPLRDVIPDFRINSHKGGDEGVTLRRILNHHAGLPSDFVKGMWGNNPTPVSSVVSLLHDQYLTSTPGTVFSYSNIGYSLAGHTIERVTNKPYSTFINDHILQPLGMDDSSFTLDTDNPNLSLGYVDGNPITEYDIRDKPAGGLVSTTGDLAKFVKAIMAKGIIRSSDGETRLLQETSVTAMLTPETITSPYSVDNLAALGWFKLQGLLPFGHDMLMHNGQTMAHSSLVQIGLDSKIGVVILSNSPAPEAILAIAKDIFELAYQLKYSEIHLDKNKQKELETRNAKTISPSTLPGDPASGGGYYSSEFGLIEIQGKEPRLKTKFANQKWRLQRNNAESYDVKFNLLGLLPVSNNALRSTKIHFRDIDNETLIYLEQNGVLQLVASSVQHQPHSPVWSSRIGNFELNTEVPSTGPDLGFGHLMIRRERDIYLLHVSQGASTTDYALRLISDNQAILQGYGRNMGTTLTILEGGDIEWLGLIYSPIKLGN